MIRDINKNRNPQPESRRRCMAIVCRLGANVRPEFEAPGDEGRFVLRVLREEKATIDDFFWLDEKPGNDAWNGYEGFHGEWHSILRRARNNREIGREMFDILGANEGT